MNTIIQIGIDDKQELIDALSLALTEGEEFAKKCFDILVAEWGADKYQIDQIRLSEMGTGHLIDCCIREVSPTPYREYVADHLASYSNIGLAKMGLTRTQYEKVRNMNNTYRIIGTLTYRPDVVAIAGDEYGDFFPRDRQIDEEIEAPSAAAALDSFEVNGWEWRGGKAGAWLITEAMRMEASGQPTLFPLPAAEMKPRQLRLL